jgi:hypothetical protein
VKQPEGSLRERVQCSSLVEWPVDPRLSPTIPLAVPARNARAQIAKTVLGARRHILPGQPSLADTAAKMLGRLELRLCGDPKKQDFGLKSQARAVR